MNWKVRFLRNALFGILPVILQDRLRSMRQQDNGIHPLTVKNGLAQASLLIQSGCSLAGKSLLEIGTGWQPIIPILFYLAGCRVTTIDSQRLMREGAVEATAHGLIELGESIAEGLGLEVEEVERKLTGHIDIEYLAPHDLLNSDLPTGSFDIVTSHAVLEHVPKDVIADMLPEIMRVLRPDGFMCHIIDNSDHWEHQDKSLSRLNFLTLNDAVFSMLCAMNPLDYQNRLRHFQYRDMFTLAGFNVIKEIANPHSKAMEELKHLKLSGTFKNMPPEDLAVLTSYFVLAPTRSAGNARVGGG